VTPSSTWIEPKYSSTEHGTRYLNKLFSEYQPFPFPKSIYAVEDCLRVAGVAKNDIALDYFAGSGTTAHAVINLNRNDEGK
jgi:adenine-specific DNA-methyltransferase